MTVLVDSQVSDCCPWATCLYISQISGEHLQDHWSSAFLESDKCLFDLFVIIIYFHRKCGTEHCDCDSGCDRQCNFSWTCVFYILQDM